MGLALSEAIERLQSPDAPETWSALTGAPILAVDATATSGLPGAEVLTAAARRLGDLPCPTVVRIGPGTAPALRELIAAFDVVVEGAGDLTAVVEAATARPLAAAALVHVLRAGRSLEVGDALRVESLAYGTLQAGPEHTAWLAARSPIASAAASREPPVTIARERDVLVVTLARPARHNAFSAGMRDALAAALTLATCEPQLTIVLRGAGPSFCSGGDLDEFGTSSDPATAHLVRATRSPARLLAALAGRVRVEVHGACIGAGIELAAFAAQVVAAPDAFFQLPEVAMGLMPGAGGTASLPRRIGRQRTAYLALTGRRIDATTARAWGLVDAIEPGA